MLRGMLIGAAAGAAGTTALNAVTYGDMLVRGRPASGAPSEAAARLAEKAGLDLSAEGEAPDGPTAQNRRSGLGALLGFFPGLGVGVATGSPGVLGRYTPCAPAPTSASHQRGRVRRRCGRAARAPTGTMEGKGRE